MRGPGFAESVVRSGRMLLLLSMALLFVSNAYVSVAQDDSTTPEPPVTAEPAQEPAPVELAPVEPAPVEPAPVDPAPVEPAPVEPAPVEPAPVDPAPAEPAPVEPAPVVPPVTEVPPAPTDVPATLEPIPTETEVVVVPEATVAPTEAPTAEPTATAAPTATAEPSPTPSPTPEPIPVVTWSQTDPVKCELRNGAIGGLKYEQSNRYYCEAVVNVSSDIEMPDDMKIEWKLDLAFPDSYMLEFPVGSQAAVKTQIATGTNSTQYTITQPWVSGAGSQKLNVEVVITRNTCAVGEQVLRVQAAPSITTVGSKAEIKRQDGNIHPDPTKLQSPVIDSAEPEVAFEGNLTFDAISVDSTGASSDVIHGRTTVVVNGEWDPCTTWTVNLTGELGIPAESPVTFRLAAINNEPIPGDACDLQSACDVIVLPAVVIAATPLRYTIGLELRLNEFIPTGDFGINLNVRLNGLGTIPSSKTVMQ